MAYKRQMYLAVVANFERGVYMVGFCVAFYHAVVCACTHVNEHACMRRSMNARACVYMCVCYLVTHLLRHAPSCNANIMHTTGEQGAKQSIVAFLPRWCPRFVFLVYNNNKTQTRGGNNEELRARGGATSGCTPKRRRGTSNSRSRWIQTQGRNRK